MSRPLAIAEAAISATVAGSAVGLVEMAWLWWGGGLDATMLPWAVGLYGVVGLGVGLAAGGVVAVAMTWWSRACWWAGGAGIISAFLAIGGVVGRYVLNRDVFAELGVPLWALAVLVLGLLGLGLIKAVLLARVLPGDWRMGLFSGLGVGWMGALAVAVVVGGAADGSSDGPVALPATTSTAQGPNVLFVLVDTLRADHLDRADLATPALDALRQDAVTFSSAWSQASWTRPGVASLWTSRTPSNHTATQKGSRLPDAVVTWAEVLQTKGWATGALVNNINVTEGFGFNQGFDTFYYEAPEYPFGASQGVFNLALYKVVHRVEERLMGGGGVDRYYAPAPQVLQHATDWIDARGTGPWALSVHLMEPHDPYFDEQGAGYSRAAHPEPNADEADALRRLYGLEIERLDAALGEFIKRLRSSGAYDDTLIVFTSDHGEEFYEHGGWWHGTSLYTEQTHIPLVVKLPGQRFGGSEAPWQVRAVDVAPTIAAAVKTSPDASWEGRDLLGPADRAALAGSELRAPRPADPATACRLARSHRLDRAVLMEEDFEGNRIEAVRTGGFSLYLAEPGGSRDLPAQELFDVVDDPAEQRALQPSGAAICSQFPEDWAGDLEAALRLVKDAGGRGVQSVDVVHSEEERVQLCALGYLTGEECR